MDWILQIVTKVYDALSRMVGNVWGATLGLMGGFMIGGAGL